MLPVLKIFAIYSCAIIAYNMRQQKKLQIALQMFIWIFDIAGNGRR